MAKSRISELLAGERPSLLWIEFGGYARRVFATSAAAWNSSPSLQAGAIAQAHRVLPSEVVSVDLIAPFVNARQAGDDAASALERVAPRNFAFEVFDAVAHSLSGRADIVLRVPAPADLCRALSGGGEAGFSQLDDAMMAVADLVRAISAKTVSALLIATAARRHLSEDEIESLETLIGSAHYYDWPVALAAVAAAGKPDAVALLLDDEAAPAGRNIGGGLSARFWAGGTAPATGAVLFGQIPEDAKPESVLAAVSALGAKNAR